jgi:hypothetical protein
MSKNTKPDLNIIDFQTQTKYFFETATQCFDICIQDFQGKSLTA